jgi:hypothetical protein
MRAICTLVLSFMLVQCTTKEHELIVEVVAFGLDQSDDLFLAGSDSLLGNWQPDGLPMDRINDTLYRVILSYPKDTLIAFKVTPGNWENEPLDSLSRPFSNTVVQLTHDTLISFRFFRWNYTYWRVRFSRA